jgi:hypothetical protein
MKLAFGRCLRWPDEQPEAGSNGTFKLSHTSKVMPEKDVLLENLNRRVTLDAVDPFAVCHGSVDRVLEQVR